MKSRPTIRGASIYNSPRPEFREFRRIYPRFIVDVSDTIQTFGNYEIYHQIASRMPITEIIESMLTLSLEQSANRISNTWVYDVLEERLGPLSEVIDFSSVALFYDLLQSHLDEEIFRKYPNYYYTEDYVFERWVDETSVMMVRYGNMYDNTIDVQSHERKT